jgi:exonuclease III
MTGDVIVVQEHGIQAHSMGAAHAVAHQHGFALVAGPQDETGHSGVAVLARAPTKAQEDECCSEEGRNARALGRLLVVRVDLPHGLQVIVITAYCWSGSSDRGLLRDRSTALLSAVRLEAACRRDEMVVIAADINGDIEDFEPLVAAQVEG